MKERKEEKKKKKKKQKRGKVWIHDFEYEIYVWKLVLYGITMSCME